MDKIIEWFAFCIKLTESKKIVVFVFYTLLMSPTSNLEIAFRVFLDPDKKIVLSSSWGNTKGKYRRVSISKGFLLAPKSAKIQDIL